MDDEKKEKLSFNVWVCQECKDKPIFEYKEYLEHLKNIHAIDLKTAKVTSRWLGSLDATNWYQNNYDVAVEGLKFIHQIRGERDENDPLRTGVIK